MPEGPEIRRAADNIAKVLEGETVEIVRFGQPRLRHYPLKLSARKFFQDSIKTPATLLSTKSVSNHSVCLP